jgi:hypothetical protein
MMRAGREPVESKPAPGLLHHVLTCFIKPTSCEVGFSYNA